MTPLSGQRLVERFTSSVERGDSDQLPELYTADAVFDAHVPNWRFQVQGPAAIAEQLKGWFQLPGRFHELQTHATVGGDLLVRFAWCEQEDTEEAITSREMQLWRLAGGQIAEQVVFCAGRWDAHLVSQMTAEAPLRRPLTTPALEAGPGETLAAVERFDNAFGRHDIDEVMDAMTDDCVFEDTTPPDGRRHEGQPAVRRCWDDLFTASPDAVFETEELLVAGDRAIVRWRYRWTNDGGGHVRGVDLFRVRDGKVAEKHSYVKG